MKIIPLQKSRQVYSCYSYLILGDWNRLDDVNTVIDPGVDGFIIDEIERISTGVGKSPVAQVILTHQHFDHAAGREFLKERYQCRVLATSGGTGIDQLLTDRQFIKAGDQLLEVLHTPGHSNDSICLYAPSKKAIFCGDTQLRVHSHGGAYPLRYMAAGLSLGEREIQKIYSGHDGPLPRGADG